MPTFSRPARRFELGKGLDVDLAGRPSQVVVESEDVASVGLVAEDYSGFRLDVLVEAGEEVRLGQPLLRSRERPELVITSPGAGTVKGIGRGRRRALRSIVVELGGDEEVEPVPANAAELGGLRAEDVLERLLTTGSWTALRERPFGRLADPRARPHSLFVTAIDTNPLAPDPAIVLAERAEDFRHGLQVLTRLVECPVFLCTAADSELPGCDLAAVTVAEFAGPHPAGLPGTHMHWLDPVRRGKTNWHVGYQDVAAIGRLFTRGRLDVERVVALAGPKVRRPRLVRTRLGASIDDLVRNELEPGPCRVVSGSVLSGYQASGWGRHLGRYHLSVSVLPEEETALRGRPAPMIPDEAFERVLPLDLLPAPLLRALVVGDLETAEDLGCLELVEEDLALCTYVCPGKLQYGRHLRAVLDEIAREA